jgi:O-antigen/teichoic acid export membrane protein
MIISDSKLICCKRLNIFPCFFPLLVGLALVADDFISVVLGEKWIPIVLLLQLFCIIGVFKSINSIIAPILISKGRTDLNFKYNLISAILLPVSFLLGVQFGLKGIAIAWIVSYPLLTVYLLEIGLNEIGLTFGEYMKSLLPAFKATIFMMGIILFFQLLKYDNKTVMLIGSISAGVLSYIMFFAAMQKDTLVEAKEIFISMKKNKVSKLINKG